MKKFESAQACRDYLFEVFIEQSAKQSNKLEGYSSEQIKQWLSWLTQKMSIHEQTIFQVAKQRNWGWQATKGLFNSLTTAFTGGMTWSLIAWLLIGLLLGLCLGWGFVLLDEILLAVAVAALGPFFGLFVGLIFRISDILISRSFDNFRYYIRRFFLWRQGHFPWNYLRFLNYATQSGFLHQIGDSYTFMHRSLFDYFANRTPIDHLNLEQSIIGDDKLIEQEIARRIKQGWKITDQSKSSVQLHKPKRWSIKLIILGTILLCDLGVGIVFWLLAFLFYIFQKEKTMFLTAQDLRTTSEREFLSSILGRSDVLYPRSPVPLSLLGIASLLLTGYFFVPVIQKLGQPLSFLLVSIGFWWLAKAAVLWIIRSRRQISRTSPSPNLIVRLRSVLPILIITGSIALFSKFLLFDVRSYIYYLAYEYYDESLELREQDITKAIELDPDNILYLNERADLYISWGECKDGLDDYNKIIELEPGDASYYASRGGAHHCLKHLVAAENDYTKAIELNPDNPTYYHQRADVYYDKIELDKGIADEKKAFEFDFMPMDTSEKLIAQHLIGRAEDLIYFDEKYDIALIFYYKAKELEPTLVLVPEVEVALKKADAFVNYYYDINSALTAIEEAVNFAQSNDVNLSGRFASAYNEICKEGIIGEATDSILMGCERAAEFSTKTANVLLNLEICQNVTVDVVKDLVSPACKRVDELAKKISFNQTVESTIYTNGGEIWVFEGDKRQVVTITLAGDASTHLSLLGPEMDTLAESHSNIDSFILPETTSYYIVVTSSYSYEGESEAYKLTLINEKR